jgi:hypothetical protein
MSAPASRLHPIARELAVLSRAGYPLVYMVTQEERRALGLVRQAAEAGKKAFARWSVAAGFGEGGEGEAADGDPSMALDMIARSTEPALFVLLDFHHALADTTVVRRLRERLDTCVERRQTVVIVAPVVVLPPELEKDTALLDLPLPKAAELEVVLTEVLRSERITVDPVVAERAVRSALGLTESQAMRVFRRVIVLRKGLSEEDLKLIVEEKKAVLRKTDVLEFHELGESLRDVGGLGEPEALAARARDQRLRASEARAFGLPPPKGLLLLGVQGCGKSHVGQGHRGPVEVPLLRLDVGACSRAPRARPRRPSARPSRSPSASRPVVLWVDEIEKGFAGSGEGQRVHHSRHACSARS